MIYDLSSAPGGTNARPDIIEHRYNQYQIDRNYMGCIYRSS